MINLENEIFTIIAKAVRDAYPGAYVVGEYVKSPPKFPYVSIIEGDNTMYEKTQSSGSLENHASVMYEVNIYSNKASGKKSECKVIAAIIDEQMMALGFARTMLQPIPNMDDVSVYRMVGRYSAIISKEKVIFRR